MTVSTSTTSSIASKVKGMKRSISYPKALHMAISESACSKDAFLQSSNPRRRYMRRGSRCPSMLRATLSLPKDLSTLDAEFNLAQDVSPSSPSSFSFLDVSSHESSDDESRRNRAAVDLVTEALNLSTNFDDLDLDTN